MIAVHRAQERKGDLCDTHIISSVAVTAWNFIYHHVALISHAEQSNFLTSNRWMTGNIGLPMLAMWEDSEILFEVLHFAWFICICFFKDEQVLRHTQGRAVNHSMREHYMISTCHELLVGRERISVKPHTVYSLLCPLQWSIQNIIPKGICKWCCNSFPCCAAGH